MDSGINLWILVEPMVERNEFKPYLEQLIRKNGQEIKASQLSLLDEFVNDEKLLEAFIQIKTNQKTMLEKWKERTQIEDIKSKQIVLTNGTVGRAYDYVFDIKQLTLLGLGDYDVVINPVVGVSFDKTDNKISGTLMEAGEHILIMSFRLQSESPETLAHKKEIKLIVNPDPKSLWKNVDSDANDPYWKKDDVSSSRKFGLKNLVVGSKRGRSHAHEGIFRDDAYAFEYYDETGWGIIAVADGAGSAKYSRKGSELACKAVIEYFGSFNSERFSEMEVTIQSYLENETEESIQAISNQFIAHLGKAALCGQNSIREECTSEGAEMRDFSTTLIFSIVKKYGEKYVIASFWVGDGGIGIYSKEKNEVYVLGIPDSGEFAGQTRFLTMSDIFANGAYANRIKFKVVEDFTALVLMTDGITDPKFQTDNNLNRIEIWNQFWADLNGENQDNCGIDFSGSVDEAENALMTWLDFWSPGNHDDRTIAILY